MATPNKLSTTTGVKMTFTAEGSTFSVTVSKLDSEAIGTAAQAKELAKKYAKIIDGTLTGVQFISTETVDITD